MDPRHPELSVKRIRDLMSQYDQVEHDMGKAMTSAELAKLEREGGLVVQEICLTAPRMHEALIQTSRMRRQEIARGILIEPQDTAVELPEPTEEKETISKKETVAKKTTKKKTTKKTTKKEKAE